MSTKAKLSEEVTTLSASNEQLTKRIEDLAIKVRGLTMERDELAMKLSCTERVLEAQKEHCKQHAVDMRVIEAQLAGQKSAFEASLRLALESRNGTDLPFPHDGSDADEKYALLSQLQGQLARRLSALQGH